MLDSGGRDWGTTAVLLIDLVATIGVSIWGVIYLRTDLKYLFLLVAITLGLAFLTWALIRSSQRPPKRLSAQ
jgi:hypothetical protein